MVVFSRGKIRNKPQFYLNGECLETVDSQMYLGIMFNYNGSFKKAVKYLYDKASRAMFEILKRSKALRLDIDTTLHMFDTLVTPILLYGCEVWGYDTHPLIEKLHLRFLKLLLHLRKSTPNCMVYGETGRFELYILIRKRALSYWFKLITGNGMKWSSHMYCVLYSYYVEGSLKLPWIAYIHKTLCTLGLMYIWNDSTNCNYAVNYNVNMLKRLVQQLSIDQFMQNWSSEINNSNKCLCYRVYKQEFGLEKYLLILPLALRIPYTRLRCRNNRLQIEIGSYENSDRELRLCNKCDIQTLRDKFHASIIMSIF